MSSFATACARYLMNEKINDTPGDPQLLMVPLRSAGSVPQQEASTPAKQSALSHPAIIPRARRRCGACTLNPPSGWSLILGRVPVAFA